MSKLNKLSGSPKATPNYNPDEFQTGNLNVTYQHKPAEDPELTGLEPGQFAKSLLKYIDSIADTQKAPTEFRDQGTHFSIPLHNMDINAISNDAKQNEADHNNQDNTLLGKLAWLVHTANINSLPIKLHLLYTYKGGVVMVEIESDYDNDKCVNINFEKLLDTYTILRPVPTHQSHQKPGNTALIISSRSEVHENKKYQDFLTSLQDRWQNKQTENNTDAPETRLTDGKLRFIQGSVAVIIAAALATGAFICNLDKNKPSATQPKAPASKPMLDN